MYPSSYFLSKSGIDIETAKVMIHVKKVAIANALSYNISAKYSQVTHPAENWKKHMKSRTQTSMPIVSFLNEKYDNKNRVIAISE